MNLTDWQNSPYFQLKARPQTVRQFMGANALPEDQIEKALGELEALGLAREQAGGSWRLSTD